MRRDHSHLLHYAGITIVLLILIACLPANRYVTEAYNLSAAQYRVLILLVELPIIALWFFAFYGYGRLKQYTNAIEGTETHAGFDKLRQGCTWLAFSLPIPAVIGLIVNAVASVHQSLHPAAIIFNNYFALIFSFIAFTIISQASHMLLKESNVQPNRKANQILLIVFALLGVLYCFLTLRHHDFAEIGSSNNPYFLPVWLFVITILIPNLYAWFSGLLGAYNIATVANNVQGTLYRSALRLLSSGLVIVIVSLVGVQYIRTIIPRVGHLSLNKTLLVIYIIYVIAIIGFSLMALGAKRLKRIEEV